MTELPIVLVHGGAPVQVIDLDAGHNAMISQPEALAGILRGIVERIAAPSL